MKPLLLAAALALAMTAQGRSWSINLTDGTDLDAPQSTMPYRDIEQVDDGIIVTYRFNYANLQDATGVTGAVNWSIPGFGTNYVAGEPATLFRNDRFLIPDGKNCSVSLLNCEYRDFDAELSPAREYSLASDTTTNNRVTPIKPYEGFFPQTAVEGYNRGRYRGKGIYYASVSPIQYNYQTKKVRAYTTLSYKITYTDATSPIRKAPAKQPYISPDDNFLSNLIAPTAPRHTLDPDSVKSTIHDATAPPVNVTKDYLIITTNSFLNSAEKLAEWKKLMGFRVEILSNESWIDYDEIKAQILDYHKQHPNLYYITIIGRHEIVPGQEIFRHLERDESMDTSGGCDIYYTSDYHYGCMVEEEDEDDAVPEVYVGRLPANSAAEAATMVQKIIQYEQTPITDENFYQQALHCAYFEGQISPDGTTKDTEKTCDVKTSEEILCYLKNNHNITPRRVYTTDSDTNPKYYEGDDYAFHEEIPQEIQRPHFKWDGSESDITESIMNGSLYVVALTHGLVDKWVFPDWALIGGIVANYLNWQKRPLVFSMGCNTGEYSGSKRSIAESFLRNPHGGAIAVFAPSEKSIAGWNNALLYGMIDAIWPNPGIIPIFPSKNTPGTIITPTPTPTYELGQILAQGRFRLFETFWLSQQYYERDYIYELFHCFGDPSLKLNTSTPKKFDNYVSISRGKDDITVLCNIKAKITFYNKYTGDVVSYYGYKATYKEHTTENVTVCISGHNMIPYIDWCRDYDITDLYIQNQEFSNSSEETLSAYEIHVGSNVDPNKNEGPVVFRNGKITLQSDVIKIHSGVTIYPEAKLSLKH